MLFVYPRTYKIYIYIYKLIPMNYTILYIHTYMHACMHVCMYAHTYPMISRSLMVFTWLPCSGFSALPRRRNSRCKAPRRRLPVLQKVTYATYHHRHYMYVCIYIYIFDLWILHIVYHSILYIYTYICMYI